MEYTVLLIYIIVSIPNNSCCLVQNIEWCAHIFFSNISFLAAPYKLVLFINRFYIPCGLTAHGRICSYTTLCSSMCLITSPSFSWPCLPTNICTHIHTQREQTPWNELCWLNYIYPCERVYWLGSWWFIQG